jgi:hypothetical protein
LTQVATQIFASAEYQSHIVDVFFQVYLRRRSDPVGNSMFANLYAQGVINGVEPSVLAISILLASGEYDGLVQANGLLLPITPLDSLKSFLP